MLTYGGIPLLLPDADGELQTWLRQNQDIADAVIFGGDGDTTLADKSPRRGLLAWGGDRKGIGQTVANYAAAPPARINSLYWPTGATRWARGYFLATGKNKNKITALAHSVGGNTPLVLKWGDAEVRTPLTASMYLLPPRPISRVAAPYDGEEEQLWLLTLVDERYWWQQRATSDLEISNSTTWANLFSTLGSALGVTVSLPTAVDADYLSPDHYEFTRRYENAAMMLDAAALSVGKRIVRRLDGTVRAENNADAESVIEANAGLPAALMAGGYYHLEAGYRPAKVTVTFRKWRHYRLLQKGQVYTVDKTPSITTASASGTERVFHSTLHADYSSDTSPPANTSDLDALAQVISDDFYGWLRSRYDLTFAGAQPWELNGFDDSVIWDFGRQVVGGAAGGVRLGQTRVQSMPVDFGFDLQLSQKNTLTLFESPMVCKPDADIDAEDSGTVSVWTGRAGAKTDSTLDVIAYAEHGAVAGEFAIMRWIEDDWEIGTGDGEGIVRFELLAPLSLTGHAKAKKLQVDIGSGDWEDTDPVVEIEVYDPYRTEGMWTGAIGFQGFAKRRQGDDYTDNVPDPDEVREAYDVIWMEQLAETIEFTTSEYMSESDPGECGASVTMFDNQGVDPGSSVIVYDPFDRFEDVFTGAKGSAKYDYSSGQYIIVSCQRLALFAECIINSDVSLCGDTLSFDDDIHDFEVVPLGEYVGAGDSSETTILNPCGHAACGLDLIKLRRVNNDPDNVIWEIYDVTKHTAEFFTDFQISGTTLQFKKRAAYIEACDCAATPEWVTYHTGTDCPPE